MNKLIIFKLFVLKYILSENIAYPITTQVCKNNFKMPSISGGVCFPYIKLVNYFSKPICTYSWTIGYVRG